MKNIYFLLFAMALVAFSCKQKPYNTTAKGLKYKIYKSEGGAKAKLGDVITFQFVLTNSKDSVLQSTYKMGKPYINKLSYASFGSMAEGFLMLGKGDSAAFFMSADSMTKGHPDKALPAGTLAKYTIKMMDVQNPADYEKVMKAEQEKAAREAEENKAKEPALLADYIKTKAPNALKNDSGMYYIIEKEGTGPKPEPGDSVVAHYSGTLLNGAEFDNDHGQPFSFILGQHQVIEGWDEGFALLNKGAKAKLIIPSRLAYGKRAFGTKIPAYSTLVFEVELVDFAKPHGK